MDEAERCDRVALMQDGRFLDTDTPASLIDSFKAPLFSIRGSSRLELIRALRKHPHAGSVHPFGESLHYVDDRPSAQAGEIADFLHEQGFEDAVVKSARPTVEDCFMQLMQ
jgi:ABC-type multidrug transport system ATPase subunit